MKAVYLFLTFCFLIVSCEKKTADPSASQTVNSKKNDSVFKSIDKKWLFTKTEITPETAKILTDWEEWNDFEREIISKPVTSLNAFRKKAAQLAMTGITLSNNIPETFKTPAVESRIALLQTNLNSLDMYMELDVIQQKKVEELLAEINKNYLSIGNQFDEILLRKAIPKEQGEDQLIQSFETIKRASRNAIPTE